MKTTVSVKKYYFYRNIAIISIFIFSQKGAQVCADLFIRKQLYCQAGHNTDFYVPKKSLWVTGFASSINGHNEVNN